jgi:hypothetical protein
MASAGIATLLLIAGCASGSSTGGSGASSSQSSGSPARSSSAAPSSTSSAKATVIVVSVKDGKVTPKAHRVKVAVDSPVQIMVTTDVDDEVHVHGYDIEREVSAGEPVSIEFTADQSGVFEVETHESDLLLLQLQVQ